MTLPLDDVTPKKGYIAFFKGKHHTLAAVSKQAAMETAATHFGVAKSKAWMIHIEEAPIDAGSNP